uniref:O-acyltransferase WSD1 C-terminal domain-containing protein n=1 Tax=Aegilops tauschii subsp. strangulata TaxID=200361 RepID=A0A452XM00_AEGTS
IIRSNIIYKFTNYPLSLPYLLGDTNTKIICLRSILLVNMRPTSGLQEYVNMMESGKSNDMTRRNQLGYIILPFQIAVHKDPLEYIRKAKKIVDRKKSSLEVMFTHMLAEVIIKTLGVKRL